MFPAFHPPLLSVSALSCWVPLLCNIIQHLYSASEKAAFAQELGDASLTCLLHAVQSVGEHQRRDRLHYGSNGSAATNSQGAAVARNQLGHTFP